MPDPVKKTVKKAAKKKTVKKAPRFRVVSDRFAGRARGDIIEAPAGCNITAAILGGHLDPVKD